MTYCRLGNKSGIYSWDPYGRGATAKHHVLGYHVRYCLASVFRGRFVEPGQNEGTARLGGLRSAAPPYRTALVGELARTAGVAVTMRLTLECGKRGINMVPFLYLEPINQAI
jgi:hypothetical protein